METVSLQAAARRCVDLARALKPTAEGPFNAAIASAALDGPLLSMG
jgi:hypothetical protein